MDHQHPRAPAGSAAAAGLTDGAPGPPAPSPDLQWPGTCAAGDPKHRGPSPDGVLSASSSSAASHSGPQPSAHSPRVGTPPTAPQPGALTDPPPSSQPPPHTPAVPASTSPRRRPATLRLRCILRDPATGSVLVTARGHLDDAAIPLRWPRPRPPAPSSAPGSSPGAAHPASAAPAPACSPPAAAAPSVPGMLLLVEEAVLGRGGSGIVTLVFDPVSDAQFALKRLRRSAGSGIDFPAADYLVTHRVTSVGSVRQPAPLEHQVGASQGRRGRSTAVAEGGAVRWGRARRWGAARRAPAAGACARRRVPRVLRRQQGGEDLLPPGCGCGGGEGGTCASGWLGGWLGGRLAVARTGLVRSRSGAGTGVHVGWKKVGGGPSARSSCGVNDQRTGLAKPEPPPTGSPPSPIPPCDPPCTLMVEHGGMMLRLGLCWVVAFKLMAVQAADMECFGHPGRMWGGEWSIVEGKQHLWRPIDPCPYVLAGYDAHVQCLKRKHVVFLGDSISRYQYLNLAHYLYTGRWASPYPRNECSMEWPGARDTWDTLGTWDTWGSCGSWGTWAPEVVRIECDYLARGGRGHGLENWVDSAAIAAGRRAAAEAEAEAVEAKGVPWGRQRQPAVGPPPGRPAAAAGMGGGSGSQGSYGMGVDWWSFGCLLYVLLTGCKPFCPPEAEAAGEDLARVLVRIMNPRFEPPLPPYLSPHARDLLRRLLVRQPRWRLGCGGGDAEEVKGHPFFQAVSLPQAQEVASAACFFGYRRRGSLADSWQEGGAAQQGPGLRARQEQVQQQGQGQQQGQQQGQVQRREAQRQHRLQHQMRQAERLRDF
ncbi:Ribosomal protein S6 kinase alpha-5 [Tetrabaena socialis]|uniref:Ribosomal protein S6 kinase alpha-5 n=1 Tax=Tetrabaena socialis TaxID=47790 RepID=A0A2J8AD70_9CHLO|nr:Ribosomal protein S6 kinase alpha-5 [Tetrabaena socialis]|eukprot:PNH10456.1 Ribosomal protein S6 kinase alpha-5 [Tetrabaena socialis]